MPFMAPAAPGMTKVTSGRRAARGSRGARVCRPSPTSGCLRRECAAGGFSSGPGVAHRGHHAVGVAGHMGSHLTGACAGNRRERVDRPPERGHSPRRLADPAPTKFPRARQERGAADLDPERRDVGTPQPARTTRSARWRTAAGRTARTARAPRGLGGVLVEGRPADEPTVGAQQVMPEAVPSERRRTTAAPREDLETPRAGLLKRLHHGVQARGVAETAGRHEDRQSDELTPRPQRPRTAWQHVGGRCPHLLAMRQPGGHQRQSMPNARAPLMSVLS